MTQASVTYRNGRSFDGQQLIDGVSARFEAGVLVVLGPDLPGGGAEVDLNGDILSVGYVDLQVNGGGGLMFNAAPTVETLRTMAKAHRGLGVTQLLPTLITDSADITQAAINAAIEAVKEGIPGVAGLHLEGPHLSIARKGAHDAGLVRSMTDADLEALLDAAKQLPVLKVTIAPENVSLDQVKAMAQAGILLSLGHTDADFDTCQRYIAAGVRCVTHLFNAMSQMGNRAPGVVGAALSNRAVSAGLIADAVHVHPETMGVAWRSKRGPGKLFLVSDAMAVAGTDHSRFDLNGREILRQDGQLRLADGTLAGADLDLTTAISVLVHQVGTDLDAALLAATQVPLELCGLTPVKMTPNETRLNDLIRIKADLSGVEAYLDAES